LAPDNEQVAVGGTKTLSYDPAASSPLHTVTFGAAAAAQLSAAKVTSLANAVKASDLAVVRQTGWRLADPVAIAEQPVHETHNVLCGALSKDQPARR
jgi:hypothetical protein